jgi:hypothetical protein
MSRHVFWHRARRRSWAESERNASPSDTVNKNSPADPAGGTREKQSAAISGVVRATFIWMHLPHIGKLVGINECVAPENWCSMASDLLVLSEAAATHASPFSR